MGLYDKPLVTFCMMTYNQEKYVREAIRSVLAQTYNNLEILIADDCSTDKTWQVIVSEVNSSQGGGGHSRIHLHRNETNLGVAKNFENIVSLAHGEIIICQAGDDISLPNRAELIVESYLKNPDATVFCHEAIGIDENSREIRNHLVRTTAFMPLGALMAYSRKAFTEFGPIEETGAWEDDIYARRAQLLGDEVQIPKILLKYRVGCGGISSGHGATKKHRTKVAIGCLAASRQSRRDLEVIKNKITNVKYVAIEDTIDKHAKFYFNEYNMYNAETWSDRFKAFNCLYSGVNPFLYAYHFVNKVAPRWCSVLLYPMTKLAQLLFKR